MDETTSKKPASRPDQILTLSFNQDCTALAMGTLDSYALFSINSESRVDEIHDCGIQALTNIPYLPYEEVMIIERLFSSSLVALVTRQAPRKLRVCHFKKGSEICAYSFSNDIRAVKLNRSRLVVCLDDSIFIHNMRDMKLLHSMRELAVNQDGVCALSWNETNPFLAYPGSSMTGEIQLFDTVALKPTVLISAHEGPLAAIAFDSTGTKIASASTKGTVIRVHHAIEGTRLFEFRRSARRFAKIYSFAFSPDSTFLAASSDTGTIHIFRLMDPTDRPREQPASWMGTLTGALSHFLPKQPSEVLTQDRAFAFVHQPQIVKNVVSMNSFNQTLKLYVAGYDGIVHIYEVDMNVGSECKKTSQYILFHLPEHALQQLPAAETNGRPAQSLHEPAPVYPSNTLRADDKNHRVIPLLANERASMERESFKTIHNDDSNQSVPK